jgi:hypothetical protein
MTSIKNAIAALTTLANKPDGKSQAARIRGVMPYIESALASGVSRQSVLDALRDELNITMGMKSFEKALQRIRREHKKQGVVSGNADKSAALTGELVVHNPKPITGELADVINEDDDYDDDAYLGSMDEKQEKGFIPKLDDFVAEVERKMPPKRVLIVKTPNKT